MNCKVRKVLTHLKVWPYGTGGPYTPYMTKPQSLPVEEARKKFADILDGSQFRNTHTEITRRGKPAGYVVPPEWYASITGEVEALRRKVDDLTALAEPPVPPRGPNRAPVPERRQRPVKPEPQVEERPLTDEEAKTLAELARSRATPLQLQGIEQDVSGRPDGLKNFIYVSSAMSMGLLTHDEVYGERPGE